MNGLPEIARINEAEITAAKEIRDARQQAQALLNKARQESNDLHRKIMAESRLQAENKCSRIISDAKIQIAKIKQNTETEIHRQNKNFTKNQSKAIEFIIEEVLK